MEKAAEAPVKHPSLWDRWPGKVGVPLLTCILGVLLKDGCDRTNRQTQALDYFVVPTSSLIQRPNLGDKPLSVMVDGRPVENLSAVTFYLVNRSSDDYENVPVEVSFAMPDGSPVQLVGEIVRPNRFASTSVPATAPAVHVTRRYSLGVANRQRANEALLKVEYVFANARAPDVSVYVDKKGLVAEQQQVLRAEDVDRWAPYVFIVFGVLLGLFLPWTFKTGGRLADRTLAQLKGPGRSDAPPTSAAG